MSKMTKAALETAMATYVAAAKQAGVWSDSNANLLKAVDKIGKTIQINGIYADKLAELEGDNLPLGKTIEEYFIDLTMPETYSDIATEGAKDDQPALPAVEDVCYNYTLGRQKVKTTVPFDNLERAFNTSEGAAAAITDISVKLQNSVDMTKYQMKKQLLGNVASKAIAVKATVSDVYKAMPVPVDTNTSEAFITAIKEAAEDASFAHQGGLGNRLIGAAPELKLYVKKGVMPIVEVEALAGAFNSDKLALPASVTVVDDFGTITGETEGKKVYAILIDPRGVKLHEGYNASRYKENADGDFVNYVRHFEETGFISKSTFVRVFEG